MRKGEEKADTKQGANLLSPPPPFPIVHRVVGQGSNRPFPLPFPLSTVLKQAKPPTDPCALCCGLLMVAHRGLVGPTSKAMCYPIRPWKEKPRLAMLCPA